MSSGKCRPLYLGPDELNHSKTHQNHMHNSWDVLYNYRQVSNIRHTLAGNEIIDHSDVVGASPVGAAPTTSSFST